MEITFRNFKNRFYSAQEFKAEKDTQKICEMAVSNWGNAFFGFSPPPDFREGMLIAIQKLEKKNDKRK